jgi:hypothetical protein
LRSRTTPETLGTIFALSIVYRELKKEKSPRGEMLMAPGFVRLSIALFGVPLIILIVLLIIWMG